MQSHAIEGFKRDGEWDTLREEDKLACAALPSFLCCFSVTGWHIFKACCCLTSAARKMLVYSIKTNKLIKEKKIFHRKCNPIGQKHTKLYLPKAAR